MCVCVCDLLTTASVHVGVRRRHQFQEQHEIEPTPFFIPPLPSKNDRSRLNLGFKEKNVLTF